jgi:uncharacterized protein (DUF488 family)
MKLYTIGFTQKSAQRFFDLLQSNGVQRLIDTRLRAGGQLSGFAKQDDLRFFLDRLIGCDYEHLPELAPEDDFLAAYRKDHDWTRYAGKFEALMDARNIPKRLDRTLFQRQACCLLCSEAKPDRCHRRLVAERIARSWPGVEVVHLT